MKFKLTGLGIVSAVLYLLFSIYNSNQEMAELAAYPWGRSFAYLTSGLGVLSIIPSIEFMVKAFKKHYLKETYQISMLSIVLTVLSFGMPLFMYAFTSLGMKILFGSTEDHDVEVWGFVILSIFTLGFVWLIFLIAIGPALFVYRKATENIFTTEEASGLEVVSLILATLVTLGIIWPILGISLVYLRVYLIIAGNNTGYTNLEIPTSTKVWAIVIGILTVGVIPLVNFLQYFTYELFFNNIESREIEAY